VTINGSNTRIVHVRDGFELLGYKVKRGRQLWLPASKIRSGARLGALYAHPSQKSLNRSKDRVRRATRRKAPVSTGELIEQLNPVLLGWGQHYKRAHV
jgi:hypothetical protein